MRVARIDKREAAVARPTAAKLVTSPQTVDPRRYSILVPIYLFGESQLLVILRQETETLRHSLLTRISLQK